MLTTLSVTSFRRKIKVTKGFPAIVLEHFYFSSPHWEAAPLGPAECGRDLAPVRDRGIPGESDFGTATENEATRRETLNIVSDFVNLKRTPLMATNAESP
jgi:hypothetical protein